MRVIDHAIVDVLVVRGDTFLFVEESKPGRAGLYNLPGGHVEGHETLLDTAVREVLEESGYEIEITGVVGIYQTILPALNISGPVLLGKVTGGEARPTKEHPRVAWFTQQEVVALAKDKKLFTAYPPFAINHYMTRGAFPLDMIAVYQKDEDKTNE